MSHRAPSSPSPLAAAAAREIPRRLLEWYDLARRDLPWRRSRDPYAILVSEYMLQQTQVATVIPYYERFLRAFPTIEALAAAPEQAVLREWAGLGYYSRARHLHAAAAKIVADCGGRVPDRFAELLFLPGVGRYVAGAVASIAFGVAVAAVDANVVRVVGRLTALTESPDRPRTRQWIEDVATELIPRERPGDFNQALMELGALVCTPGDPVCAICPLAPYCRACASGHPADYPPPPARKAEVVAVEEACAVVRRGARFLLVRFGAGAQRYRGLWAFPCTEPPPGGDAAEALTAWLREGLGVAARVESEWAELRHQVTRHRIRRRIFLCEAVAGKAARHARGSQTLVRRPPRGPSLAHVEEVAWVTLDEAEALALGAPCRRILDLLRESASLFGL
jgi:A/G-specific adenine glycosylase